MVNVVILVGAPEISERHSEVFNSFAAVFLNHFNFNKPK